MRAISYVVKYTADAYCDGQLRLGCNFQSQFETFDEAPQTIKDGTVCGQEKYLRNLNNLRSMKYMLKT